MLRILSFLDETTGAELVMPVTPPGYGWSYGSLVETIALDQLGEINLRGGRKLAQKSLEFLLPAQLYPFCNPGTLANPWHYRDRLNKWSDSMTPVRYIVSGTPINVAVLIEDVDCQERDGTNDVYCSVTMREYQRPDAPVLPVAGATGGTPRPAESATATAKTYTVVKGDTLWGIAKRFYGRGEEYGRLASANSIKNANLIYPGQVLTIPPLDNLPAAGAATASQTLAASTNYDPATGTWR